MKMHQFNKKGLSATETTAYSVLLQAAHFNINFLSNSCWLLLHAFMQSVKQSRKLAGTHTEIEYFHSFGWS